MTDKYEKVKDMTVGKVVDAMLNGEQFYNDQQDPPIRFDFERIDIFALNNWLKRGCVCRKIETPWWEKHVGSIVMARDSDDINWTLVVFCGYSVDELELYPFYDEYGSGWRQMRPLTAAEKDAIVTEG